MTLYLIFIKKYRAFALVNKDGKSLHYLHKDDRAAVFWAISHGYSVRLPYGMEWGDIDK